MPRISVIILNRDGARLLERCLSSLQRHITWRDIEILVVDHGSTDGSLDVLTRWSQSLPMRVIACRENYSFSYSNNRAAEIATGDLLLLLNNDIVFAGDPLPRMVAVLEAAGAGAVGLKQYQADSRGSAQAAAGLHHIGVRWAWNRRRCNLRPYNVEGGPGDGLIADGVWHAPAATASILLCRRDVYLSVGGLSEVYAYGYEDLDFCMKLEASGRPVLVVNDAWAVHDDGATRRKRLSRAKTRDWRTTNIEVFDRRFGYALRRQAYEALIAEDGSWWGRPTRVLLVDGGRLWPTQSLQGWARRLADTAGWATRTVAGWCPPRLAGPIDIVLVQGANMALMRRLRASHPHSVVAVFEAVDAVRAAADLCLPETAEPDEVLSALRGFIRTGRRIAVKMADGVDIGCAESMAAALRGDGHSVRIDRPGHWESRLDIGDDIHVYTGKPLPPQPPSTRRGGLSRINLAIGEGGGEGYDAVLPAAVEPAGLIELLGALDACRRIGASDPALAARDGGDFLPKIPGTAAC